MFGWAIIETRPTLRQFLKQKQAEGKTPLQQLHALVEARRDNKLRPSFDPYAIESEKQICQELVAALRIVQKK